MIKCSSELNVTIHPCSVSGEFKKVIIPVFFKKIVYVGAETDILGQEKLNKSEATQFTNGEELKINLRSMAAIENYHQKNFEIKIV